ncbi:DnaD domain protein [Desulfosporosinus sp. PR]|uniref:DnaD domain-containing protein n=1 Tax=Candidatus Desulfosporosinus nitrosoreducens TaxID=3401928 RepID=UPI0027F40808|nr:DnaD domain protein [Desulfosporosinus sp. PR]MDQ7095965.1 DnaD domain protein [Desulfosporosinus sp. PR]
MAWIQSNEELATHPKTKRAARALGVSLPTLTGHLHFLWWWCLKYAQDGNLSQFDSQDIADAASWEGDPNQFVTALVECGPGGSFGFLEKSADGSLSVHDWLDYAGRLVEKREANAERMRKSRSQKARAKNVRNTSDARTGARVEKSRVDESIEPINNNAREENKASVTETKETVSETLQDVSDLGETVSKTEESGPMDLGTRAFNWAEKNWGRTIPPGEANNILAWCDEFSSRGSPDPDALVIEALKRCLDADARNANYLNAVLRDWDEHGVLTVGQIESREAERKSQKSHKRNKDPGDKPPEPPKSGKYDNFYL